MWVHYHIIYSISLVRLKPLDPNSEKMEGMYKTDNFINDITFGTSLFVFFDLNTYFQFQFAINFSQIPIIFFFKCLKMEK